VFRESKSRFGGFGRIPTNFPSRVLTQTSPTPSKTPVKVFVFAINLALDGS
tara:strand:- start:106 stop:258 length:153 start_codon:yes stop_codon:yes gene_type:complete